MKAKINFVKLICIMVSVWFLGLGIFFQAHAEAPAQKVVLAPGGVIYLVSADNKRPFPAASIYFSYGYAFSEAKPATASDLGMPDGPVMTYAEGSLIKDYGTAVYIISGGRKHPFSSAEVFTELGYSFGNVIRERGTALARVLIGQTIASSDAPHPPGTLVNDNGTIYLVTAGGKQGIPTPEIFFTHGYKFKNVVSRNAADRALFNEGLIDGPLTPAPAPAPAVPPPSPSPGPAAPPAGTINRAPSAPKISGIIATLSLNNASYTAVSTDPDGDMITYTWDWADALPKEKSTHASGVEFSASHAWSYSGNYNISVTADDGKGGSSTATYLVKVSSDPTTFGPAVSVVSPNGGENFIQGQPLKITWKRNWMPDTAFGKVNIFYRRAGLNNLIRSDTLDSGYEWIPPIDLPGGTDYKILIISLGNSTTGITLSDESDGFITFPQVKGAQTSY